MERMTGVTKGDILGKGDYAYSVPFYGEPRQLLIDFVANGYEQYEEKYDFIEQHGKIISAEVFVPKLNHGIGAYLWITSTPLYDSNGRMNGAIESIRDITEHKQAEEELKNSAEKIKMFAYSVQPRPEKSRRRRLWDCQSSGQTIQG